MKHLKRIICTFLCFFAANTLFSQIPDYHSIHYKASATIEIDGQVFSGQLNFVNVIDSFLYMQLNVGIEAGRILLTPDNILFINRLQKNYYDGDYYFFEQLIDVDIDFFTIQAIFNNFPANVPEELLLTYEADEDSFFKTLLCEHEDYPINLKLEIKKVTFNDVPKVSAPVPKSFTRIEWDSASSAE